MGGIAVDTENRTSISGLYAVGETASTGVHGANRLASNSLLECVVYASRLSQLSIDPVTTQTTFELITLPETNWQQELELVSAIRKELPVLVWQSAGICRTASVMETAIDRIEIWRSQLIALDLARYILDLPSSQRVQLSSSNAESQLRLYAETLNLLDIAYLIVKSALFRNESRGGHYRIDYPNSLTEWEVHTVVKRNSWNKSSLG
jgi:L-aspartate oxidase